MKADIEVIAEYIGIVERTCRVQGLDAVVRLEVLLRLGLVCPLS